MDNICLFIKAIRTESGCTQEEVAEIIGCSQGTISNIETGKSGDKSEFKKICLIWALKANISMRQMERARNK